MKKIEAIIDPETLSRVISSLHAMSRFPGITVSDAQGQGRGEGPGGRYISHGPSWAFVKKTRLEICCTDYECDQLIDVICKASNLGEATHGMINVTTLDRVIRTRTGQQQDEAL